jgi:hypothetical protein
MTDDKFYEDVALLVEAARIRPRFAALVEAATTDEEVDALVQEARAIVDEDSEQAWV